MISRGGVGLLALVCALGCGNSADDALSTGSGGSGGSNQLGQAGSSGANGIAGGSSAGASGAGGDATHAGIEMRFTAPAASSGGSQHLLAFSGGGAVRPGLESLEYYIYSVQICETLTPSGSGFSNPSGCLQLYSGDQSVLNYDLNGD